MDCLDLLIADHNRFRGTFARFRTAHEGDNVAEMSSLANLMSQDLKIHTTIEEEIFYPAAHDLSEEIGETIDEGLQEHHVADVLDAEIKGLTPGDDEWVAKVMVLIESVEHHAEEEEKELFPSVRARHRRRLPGAAGPEDGRPPGPDGLPHRRRAGEAERRRAQGAGHRAGDRRPLDDEQAGAGRRRRHPVAAGTAELVTVGGARTPAIVTSSAVGRARVATRAWRERSGPGPSASGWSACR